jgi:peroxiredoxin
MREFPTKTLFFTQFVVGAWATKLQEKTPASATGTPVKFLADDTGKLAASLGLLFDATPILGGHRAKRAAIIVKDGKVISVEVETDPSKM